MPSSGITISNVFAAQTGPIPLSQLDADFATVANQANTLSAYSNYFVDSSGAPNSITVTVPSPLVFSYVEGVQLQVKVANTNTSQVVNVNVNGLGNRQIFLYDGHSPSVGAFVAGGTINLLYDGAAFRALSVLETGLFGDGTATNPSISFSADPDTGIYRLGPNDIAIACGGGPKLEISTLAVYPFVPVLSVTDGTVGAPVYSWFSDPNSGLYRIGADDIGLVTGGVLALEADASQNLFGKGLSVGAIKTADTARSSTITLADDPVLLGIPLAIGKYAVDLWLKPHNATTSTQGFQFRLNFSGTIASGGYSYLGIANNIAFNAQPVSTYSSTVQFTDITAASNFDYIHATGYIEVTAAGTMAVQWSQRASSANNTILDRGSYARFIRII